MLRLVQMLRALVAGVLIATTLSIAQAQTHSQANVLLRLMRVDDAFEATLKGLLENLCSSPVAEGRREQCAADMNRLLRMTAANRQMASLMTPYIEARFTPEEIAALTDFYSTAEGNEFADWMVWAGWAGYAMPKNDIRIPPSGVMRRVEEFFKAGAGKKFFSQLPEYRAEIGRQGGHYLCHVLDQKALCALQSAGVFGK
jgi:hypothetical protein